MDRAIALAAALLLAACREGGDSRRPAEAPAPDIEGVATLQSGRIPGPAGSSSPGVAAPLAPVPAPAPRPVRVEEVEVPDDLPALVVRAVGDRRLQMLFLPGMCVHPGGYAESFRHSAASRGDLVALQGDVSCGGDGSRRKWSTDVDAMDRRVDAAFRASGLDEPRNVVVIGYSQGAERAERLVAKWPEKYDRAVLLASPVTPSARKLARAQAVVLMAGTFDMSIPAMQGAVGPLRRASVAATFLELPGARHGEMGSEPEQTMDAALDFVDEP